MGISFESAKSQTLPRDLALRLAIGQAIEALAVYAATRELTEPRVAALRRLADMLRLEAEPLRPGRSLGDYGREAPLILAASQALRPSEMSDLIQRLNDAAEALQQLADHHGAAPEKVDELIKVLRNLRHVIAVSRATVSERRPTRPT